MRGLVIAAVVALGGCNVFGPTFPDVCKPYPGQTCIALGIGCDHDITVDQIGFDSLTPGLLPGNSVKPAPSHGTIKLPAIVAVLPDSTFAGGAFSLTLSAFENGQQVIGGFEVKGSVALGQHVSLDASKDTQRCFAGVGYVPCNGCLIGTTCFQVRMDCSATTTCVQTGASYACVPCGVLGGPCCTGTGSPGGTRCASGCCNTGNPDGTCVAIGDLCSVTNGSALVCQPTLGQNNCQPCGGSGEPCCPSGDGGGPVCSGQNCCDATNDTCVVPTAYCGTDMTTFCRNQACMPCGGSGEPCCANDQCRSGTCNTSTTPPLCP